MSVSPTDPNELSRRIVTQIERSATELRTAMSGVRLDGDDPRAYLVAVARAVAGRPKLLLADEPTGALHSSQGEMIMEVLQRLNEQGTTIIQVTHNPEYAARAHRVLQMRDGRFPATGAAG